MAHHAHHIHLITLNGKPFIAYVSKAACIKHIRKSNDEWIKMGGGGAVEYGMQSVVLIGENPNKDKVKHK